jgi:lysophospholipase L1-like esterase
MKRFIRWFVKVGGIVIVLFGVVMLSLEGVARLFHWWPDPLMQPDERFGFAHIPDACGWWVNIDTLGEFQTHVCINSKGLRDREYPYEKPAGVFRILVLGDSFADGLEVSLEDSFPKVLETLLNERLDMPVEVINGGVWGYGNDLELLFYRLEGRKYRPDLVLLAFQSNSDVLENHQDMETRYMGEVYKPFFVLQEGELTLTNWPFPVESVEPPLPQGTIEHVKAWLAAHSRLYPVAGHFIKRRLPDVAGILRGIGVMGAGQGDTQTGGIPVAMYLYAVDYPPEWEQGWVVTKAIIAQLRQEVEADGADLAVFLLPDRHQVEEGYLDWALRTYPAMQGQAWDLDKSNQIMRQFLGEEGIPYVETLEEFRRRVRETGRPLYYPKDGHWNVEGHRLAGELLADRLCQQRLILDEGAMETQ